ncbi:MAG TPA: hypothetical protein VIZ17_08435 [Acetobacteraceae bacterium]
MQPLSGFTGASQRGDLVAIDGAEFGLCGDQDAGHDVTGARNGFWQVLLGTEDRAGGDQRVNGALDPGDLGLERRSMAVQECRARLTSHHRDVLLGAGHARAGGAAQQGAQLDRLHIGQRTRRGMNGCAEMGDIDRVAHGEPAKRAGELAGLPRVDHGDRQRSRGERGGDHGFVATAAFQHDRCWFERLQPAEQIGQPRCVGVANKAAFIRPDLDRDVARGAGR